MVPEGWKHVTLDDAANYRRGSFPQPYGLPEWYDGEGAMPFVQVYDVDKNQKLKPITKQNISVAAMEKSVFVPSGTILVTLQGSIGRVAITQFDAYVDRTLLIFTGFKLPTNVMFFACKIEELFAKEKEKAPGGTIKTITKAALSRFKIMLPPLPEQRKIADILSTWDQAIEKTEALLSNARTQKRALMQQLLTGKRRFPAFEGQPWKEVRLGDVTTIIVSNVDKKSKDGEKPVRLCNYTDVYKRDTINPNQDFMEATATAPQIKKFGLRVGDVIITKDSETADDIAMPTYVAETAADLVCGYHLAIVRAGSEADGRFMKHYFELPHTRYYFGTRANGAIRFGLTIDGIEGANVQLPPIEEQRRIASVIERAEADIAAIAADITKLRTEKKALMQQLLTGKRRVVIDA